MWSLQVDYLQVENKQPWKILREKREENSSLCRPRVESDFLPTKSVKVGLFVLVQL